MRHYLCELHSLFFLVQCYCDVCKPLTHISNPSILTQGMSFGSVFSTLCSALGLHSVSQSANCSSVLTLEALRTVESDKRSESVKAKHRRVQTRRAQMGKEKERKRQAEGRRRGRWSRNCRLWLCALCWLCSVRFCLFLLYFYCAVWSLMNGSICKLHFI